MCEQCIAKTKNWDLFKNWFLVQATVDGYDMKAGEFGIVTCNNPNVIFNTKPQEDPSHNFTSADFKNPNKYDCNLQKKFYEQLDEFRCDFVFPPDVGYSLYNDAITHGGYDPNGMIHFDLWIFHLMGQKIKCPPDFIHE